MNMVRITSGKLKGRKIATPGGATHPMGERERLALFNMTAERLPGASVLDAFSGSGALGIEALSRGAGTVTFVEQNPAAARVIRKNLAELGLDAEVVQSRVSSFNNGKQYDVVLADPPYDDYKINEIEALIPMMKQGGVLVLSHPGEAPILSGVKSSKTRKYAGARLSVYYFD